MNCPECTKPMTPLTVTKPINFASDIQWEKWRCEPCRLIARVETTFSHDEAADAVGKEP